jgi:hypothetical protein
LAVYECGDDAIILKNIYLVLRKDVAYILDWNGESFTLGGEFGLNNMQV